MLYSFFTWGADLPTELLTTVLVITMSGALIGPHFVLARAASISIFLIFLTYQQNKNVAPVNQYWRQEPHGIGDAITYSVLLLFIAAIAQFFCHELEKSLRRARLSEAALRRERDQLEIRIAERTEQLRRANLEKINQLYRLATFGQLSSGIFHDLLNPLTAISLNLELIEGDIKNKITSAKTNLRQAILAANKMGGLISGIRKQLQADNRSVSFFINDEIKDITEILAYKARQAGIIVDIAIQERIKMNDCPVKFSQIIMNLVANAIEASVDTANRSSNGNNVVNISAIVWQKNSIIIKVKDSGAGISQENIEKIFEPFFSTKNHDKVASGINNLGLGLASVKDIVENHFQGTIDVTSLLGHGSEFRVTLPLKKTED